MVISENKLKFQHICFFLIIILSVLFLFNAKYVQIPKSVFIFMSLITIVFLFILYPDFLMNNINRKLFFKRYFFIIIYLSFFMFCIRFENFYKEKLYNFYFMGVIILFFIYAIEKSYQCKKFYDLMISLLLWIYKFFIIIGLFQTVSFLLKSGLSIKQLYIIRPVTSIFGHPNLYAITIVPIVIYLFFKKEYVWSILAAVTYIGTGSKNPVFIVVCCSVLLFKLFMDKSIKKKDIILSLSFILIFMFLIISVSLWQANNQNLSDARFGLKTFYWRLKTWMDLLEHQGTSFKSILIGNGLTTSELKVYELQNKNFDLIHSVLIHGISPHNSYVRLLYDTGIIGLGLYFLALFSIMKLIIKSKKDILVVIFVFLIGVQFSECLFLSYVYIFHFILIGVEIGDGLRKNVINKVNNENEDLVILAE